MTVRRMDVVLQGSICLVVLVQRPKFSFGHRDTKSELDQRCKGRERLERRTDRFTHGIAKIILKVRFGIVPMMNRAEVVPHLMGNGVGDKRGELVGRLLYVSGEDVEIEYQCRV